MIVSMIKFGDILISRPAGRESFLAAKSCLFTKPSEDEPFVLDFKVVKVLAPSWGDEFVTGLKSLYNNYIEASNIESPAVEAVLQVILA